MSWLAYSALNEVGVTLRIFMTGPVLVALSVAFMIFPGGNITVKESREKIKNPNVMFKEAPKGHRIAWGIFAVIGFIVSLSLYKY
jgi:hypothetical protein